MRRRLRKILLYTIVVILAIALAIQLALWTDFPRRMVISAVQQKLGLRVEASSLSTGWFGSTTLRDVKLSLPLADASFLDMPRMEVTHNWLLPLIVTRDFDLRGILLDHPNLVVRRDNQGRWNLQDVAELVARAGGGTTDPTEKKKSPALPRLRLIDGTIVVMEADGRRAKIESLTVKGDPEGSIVYRYDINVPKRLKAVGEVAPRENFKHQLQFFIEPGDWITPWVVDAPKPLRINGDWSGVINDGNLVGRLVLQEAQVDVLTANGRVAVQTAGGGRSIFNPQNLVLTSPIKSVPKVEIASGMVQINGPNVALQQLRVAAMGGQVQLDGSGDLAAKTAELNGLWQELAAGGDIHHGGSLHVSVTSPFPGRPKVTAEIATRGRMPARAWDGQINVEGTGRTWSEMDWLVSLPRIALTGKSIPIEAENVSAKISNRGSLITLTDLQWPAADRLVSRGEYNLADNTWLLRIRGGGTLKQGAAPTPFDFNLDTLGNPQRVHLNELFVHAKGIELRSNGDYVLGVPEPVSLSLYVTHVPSDLISEDELPIQGKLLVEGHVRGTMFPRQLVATGTLHSENLVVKGRPFGDIRGIVDGHVGENDADFRFHELSLLGGQWTVAGAWPYDAKDKMADTEVFRVGIDVDHLSLADASSLFKVEGVSGSLSGKWTIDLTKAKRNQLAMRGSFKASEVAANKFTADEATGEMLLRNGRLRVDPIKFRKGDKGSATASIDTTLADLKNAGVLVNVEAWPVQLSATGNAAVWADANLALNTASKSATGPIKARAIFASTRPIGEAEVEGRLEGRVASFDKVDVTAAGGTAHGHISVNADHPARSNVILSWSGLTGDRLADLIPSLEGLHGAYDGALTLDPATDPRALAPLRLRVQLTPGEDAAFRTVAVRPSKLSAFLDLASNFSLQRVVLDELPSEDRDEREREAELDVKKVPASQRPVGWNDIRIADGRIRLWARRAQHAGGAEQTHVIATLSELDLDQIVHAFKAKSDPMPARVNGELILHGESGNRDSILGSGHITLNRSDLANWDVLAVLYNIMSLGTAPKEPNGNGTLSLSLQNSNLAIDNAHYFNRGAEVWSSGVVIRDIWKLPNSPIDGYVVGSARPLSALKLPFLADVDQIFAVLQSSLSAVKIEGTVGEPKVTQSTFADVGAGLKQFLTGQVNETRK